MFSQKFVYTTKNTPFFSNFACFCTPKRCTHVQCPVLKNNANYVNFWTSLIPPWHSSAPPGQTCTNGGRDFFFSQKVGEFYFSNPCKLYIPFGMVELEWSGINSTQLSKLCYQSIIFNWVNFGLENIIFILIILLVLVNLFKEWWSNQNN